jgi:RecB family exonuclease
MRLLLGGPGCGKTTRVLEEVRQAGARKDIRVVVPTATMGEHLRNRLAREGFVTRPSCVATMAGLVKEIAPEIRTVEAGQAALLTELVLEERRIAAYAPLAGSPGLKRALAGALEELANAGCDALQWAALERMGVHRESALSEAYEGLEQKLAECGLAWRAGQLAAAARRVREGGTGISRLWLDGFFTFSRGELELIRSLKERSEVTVTLPEWEGSAGAREELLRMGFREERLKRRRREPRITLSAAATREHEASEAALRLMEEHGKGRAWHEMGVVMRGSQPYAGLMETALRRAGIPVRSYFAMPLSGHPVGRFLSAVVEAALSGWEGKKTVEALRSAVAGSGQDPEADAWEDRVREALPLSGLEAMGRIAGAAVEAWLPMKDWPGETATPAEWAERLSGLTRLVAAPSGGGAYSTEEVRAWRSRAAAMRAWPECLARTAALLPAEKTLLEGFWRQAEAMMGETSVREQDPRRDAVHLLDAVEARQWELKVVIVCGLLEGEFPRAAANSAVLGEDLRQRLRRSGVLLKTRGERESEEAFLLEVALSRATEELVLSWPKCDEQGRPTLRSFALDHIAGEPARARVLEVEPREQAGRAPRPALQGEDLLAQVRRKHALQRPTALEIYLQCPFRFHAERTLELSEPPGSPAERLNGQVLGTLIHKVIAAWHRGEGAMEELFEKHWQEMLRKERIPASHRVELARLTMLRSLRFYEQDSRMREGWKVEVEVPLELNGEGLAVRGRADRVDTSPEGRCIVYDFKYSGGSGVAEKARKQGAGLLVQGGLYLAALQAQGRTPAGFYFAGVRGEPTWQGWEEPAEVEQQIATALEVARDAVERIHGGDIRVEPADEKACQYCSFVDTCRMQEGRWLQAQEAQE